MRSYLLMVRQPPYGGIRGVMRGVSGIFVNKMSLSNKFSSLTSQFMSKLLFS